MHRHALTAITAALLLTACVPTETPAGSKPGASAKQAAVTLTAKPAPFKPTVLHRGGDYTSVLVTLTNRGTKELSVNPLYFKVTDSTGGVHRPELGMDEQQIETVAIAAGEHITGTVTVKGKLTVASVTFTDGAFGQSVRASVS